MKDTALKVAGIVFFMVAMAHLLRSMLRFEIIIGGYALPVWYSLVGFIIPLLLSIWMFKAVKALK
jgi:hypothetical protein